MIIIVNMKLVCHLRYNETCVIFKECFIGFEIATSHIHSCKYNIINEQVPEEII